MLDWFQERVAAVILLQYGLPIVALADATPSLRAHVEQRRQHLDSGGGENADLRSWATHT
jgi:hypothetical protein